MYDAVPLIAECFFLIGDLSYDPLVVTPTFGILGGLILLLALPVAVGLFREYPIWGTILVLSVVVRLPYATFRPVHDDSPVYFEAASQLLAGQTEFSAHLFVEVVMAVFILLFGVAGANVASFTASVAVVPVTGMAARSLFDSTRAGYATAVVVALNPIHVYYSSWAYTEPISLFFFVLSLNYLVRHWIRAGVVVASLVVLMRLEYAVLILAPLATLRTFDSRVVRVVVTTLPVAIFSALVAFLSFSPGSRLTIQRLLPRRLMSPLFSTSSITEFITVPVGRMTRNILFYAPHGLYWGVPYFETELVNPVLPLLFLVGVYMVIPRVRYAVLGIVALFLTVIGLFLFRELVSGTLYTSSVQLVLFVLFVGLVLVCIASGISDRRLDPLRSTVPYLVLLGVLYLGPRYILPVALVMSMYAGYGMSVIYEQFSTRPFATFEIRRPL